METLFIPAKYKKEISEEFMKKVAEIPYERVGLFTTIQFIDHLSQLKSFLEKKGKKVFVGEPTYRALEKGQVLGCDTSSPRAIEDKVDVFVYLGTGKFHSISVAIETGKAVYHASPTTGLVAELDKKEIERYKILKKNAISKAKSAKVYGILVCTKPGQYALESAKKIKQEIEKRGKRAYIFVFETLSPESLLDFPDIGAWINTACPRMAVDDIERFDKPIVNWNDLGY